jgi:hypothetical protein
MNRNDRPRGQPGTMNGAVRNGLREGQQLNAWQEVDRYPGVITWKDEALLAAHCGVLLAGLERRCADLIGSDRPGEVLDGLQAFNGATTDQVQTRR